MKKILIIAAIMLVVSMIPSVLAKVALGPEFALSKWVVTLSMVLPIILMIILGRKFLRSNNAVLSYGEALKDLFIAGIIASTLAMLISIFMYQNDDAMKIAHRDMSINAAVWGQETGMGFAGKSEAEIQIESEKMRETMLADTETQEESYPFQMSMLPMNILSSIVMYLIFALIAAIFVKEKHATSST